MALSDLVLKAKINMALARDPRVGFFDFGVHVENGFVTLKGDVGEEKECQAAEEIVLAVEGVNGVKNDLTCGMGRVADTTALVTLRFLERLDDGWNSLPDQKATTQADFLRWALWLVHKFHLPNHLEQDNTQLVEEARDQALTRIAGYLGAPKALLVLEMIRQAEALAPENTVKPARPHAPLMVSPAATNGATEESAVQAM